MKCIKLTYRKKGKAITKVKRVTEVVAEYQTTYSNWEYASKKEWKAGGRVRG
jgi:hypothetical protein